MKKLFSIFLILVLGTSLFSQTLIQKEIGKVKSVNELDITVFSNSTGSITLQVGNGSFVIPKDLVAQYMGVIDSVIQSMKEIEVQTFEISSQDHIGYLGGIEEGVLYPRMDFSFLLNTTKPGIFVVMRSDQNLIMVFDVSSLSQLKELLVKAQSATSSYSSQYDNLDKIISKVKTTF